ncbi:hypothetical protein KTS45_15010 [Halomicroarcula limicola]|uniref:Uncharacterized protein n=1 Tax=Haloarcula limicola TaxID=1429915 RepID=A0A8J8C5S4_9EURY|nr:hypothetical protein [Halomicroarcula limicola]MBV0925514.1 hypothetical protein [Halomicroarcula limicola]
MLTYDRLLASIPIPLVGGAIAGWIGLIPITLGVITGSLLGCALMFVSLFVVPPET